MRYSAMFMELASCGYFVVSMLHNDRSADYCPAEGFYDDSVKFYDQRHRNICEKMRENDAIQVAREIMEPNFLTSTFGKRWQYKSLTKDLVLMGHSFGGITALGAADKCFQAKAVIGLDPWFFPYAGDKGLKSGDYQETLIVMTENFPKEIKKYLTPAEYDHVADQKQFIQNCKKTPEYYQLKDQWHFNQTDAVMLMPQVHYQLFRNEDPDPRYLEIYLTNAWLAMKFLEDKGLCSQPKLQRPIHNKLAAMSSIIKCMNE